jgi:1,4-alpha-glucan branching enzyme
MSNLVQPLSLFTDFDISLFKSGKHYKLYEKLGAHITQRDDVWGVYFAVYAPAAKEVQVVGDFNSWSGHDHNLYVRWDGSGIWEGFIPNIGDGDHYKFKILSSIGDKILEKADPLAFRTELPPKTASIVYSSKYKWKDKTWMKKRAKFDHTRQCLSIYEVHLGSWKKNTKTGDSLHFDELAEELVSYVSDMGFSHVEFMPITEHPYYPSWGYQCTSYFAPTARFGDPDELRYLVDAFHQAGIGVILDWVPSHFATDDHALVNFDGSHVYENPDRTKGWHPDWQSHIFNYERNEIRAFLISSALYWLEEYHFDGLRVDAVASMLYLDYSRSEGEWTPNEYGGNENLAAISFLKDLNVAIGRDHPNTLMIAEESTSFDGITRAVHHGGLGFDLKWMMGWMNDTLEYMKRDPIHRQYHHGEISFSMIYAYSEKYVLPLSHDEVVHGKQSLLYKMPGDEWQTFANLRILYSYMFCHPGHKLLFMGNEFGQSHEWNVNTGLHWKLLDHEPHKGVHSLIKDLNTLVNSEKAFKDLNFDSEGFEWIDHSDNKNSILAFIRKSKKEQLIVVCNFIPSFIKSYELGVPSAGKWGIIFNSDDNKYWGSDCIEKRTFASKRKGKHGRKNLIDLQIPPLAIIVLKKEKKKPSK